MQVHGKVPAGESAEKCNPVLIGFVNSDGDAVSLALVDNGDGSYSLPVTGTVDIPSYGHVLTEQKTHADAENEVITFSQNITAIEIYHEEVTWQEFVVNGITLTVPANGYRTAIGGTPGKTVTIPEGVNCIVGSLK